MDQSNVYIKLTINLHEPLHSIQKKILLFTVSIAVKFHLLAKFHHFDENIPEISVNEMLFITLLTRNKSYLYYYSRVLCENVCE